MLFFSFIIFVLGLAVGSFLNCFIYRLEKGESALKGRSYCPKCKHQLCWYDLIPVLSYITLKGKCRYCEKKISWQYPLVEIATALLFLLIFSHQFPVSDFQELMEVSFLFVLVSFLIVIFVYDLKHYIIPDRVIYPAIGIAFIYKVIFGFQFYPFFVSACAAAGVFLLIILATRGKGMGLGDVKLAFLMGLLLGWPNILVAVFLAFLTGAFLGTILILLKKKTLKSEIPFGPFLVAGTLCAWFWGQWLVNLYLSLLL